MKTTPIAVIIRAVAGRPKSAAEDLVFSWEIGADRLRCSEGIRELFGLESAETRIDALVDRVHPRDRETATGAIESARKQPGPFSYEVRVVRPDGEVRRVFTRAEALADRDGRVVAVFGRARDISELPQG